MQVKDELEETLNSQVVKLENSQLVRLYSPQKKEPALVFLRKGVPLLYDGKDSPDEIFNFFSDNREPIVKELDDSSFEHLTQASTGSTTGDWLIFFYTTECIDCNRLQAIWETVGAKLKVRMNVARINKSNRGKETAKRFKVEQTPEIILLRQGKFYRYNLKKYDVESFTGFAQTWFKNIVPEKVQTPATPFELLIDSIVLKLKSYSKEIPNFKATLLSYAGEHTLTLLFAIAGIFIILLILILKKSQKKPDIKKATKKEK